MVKTSLAMLRAAGCSISIAAVLIDCGSARDRQPRLDRVDPRPIKC
jgi:hypothetical protein